MVYFIDFQGYCCNEEPIVKELCIINSNDMLNPNHMVYKMNIAWKHLSEIDQTLNELLIKDHVKLSWEEGSHTFCMYCLINSYGDDISKEVFYTRDENRMITLKKLFPMLRIVKYEPYNLQFIPRNIVCPYREHGEYCAYKSCLSMLVDYNSNC